MNCVAAVTERVEELQLHCALLCRSGSALCMSASLTVVDAPPTESLIVSFTADGAAERKGDIRRGGP